MGALGDGHAARGRPKVGQREVHKVRIGLSVAVVGVAEAESVGGVGDVRGVIRRPKRASAKHNPKIRDRE